MTFDDILQPIFPSSFIFTYATKELSYSLIFNFAFPFLYRRTRMTFDDILQPIFPRIDATKEPYCILFYFSLFSSLYACSSTTSRTVYSAR
ncbi:hypothetical protein L210DRAFT_3531665 [Boletus edulis BED1]|uniref:Uncharacterized protein n=1 Tax=Boletus edulis BED1 TaxID=1328754 RepID=A0AAD4C167_BOLED|nr:hypothetical protein L210DRAFT_3531665 [Boletus edulis BED1]